MKIENVKNYNQKLLAVIGTLVALFLFVLLIAFTLLSINNNRRHYSDDSDTGILSDEVIERLQEENKREQIISFDSPRLIDSLSSLYLLPVSYVTLDEKEDISELLDYNMPLGRGKVRDNRYLKDIYGQFNNVVLYNAESGAHNKIFETRVNFNEVKVEHFDNEILIIIVASDQDFYKDGVINLEDLKSLYIYSISQDKLQKIGIDGMDIFRYTFVNNSKDILIEFGIDKNGDGRHEKYNEPKIIKKFDFEEGKLVDVIDKSIISDLQKTLEGTHIK